MARESKLPSRMSMKLCRGIVFGSIGEVDREILVGGAVHPRDHRRQ